MPVSERSLTGRLTKGVSEAFDAPMLRPQHRGRPYLTIVLVIGAIAALVPTLVHARSSMALVNLWLIYSIIGIGFYFIFAVGGQFAFCQAFMAGLGAYAAGWVAQDLGFPWTLAFALVVVGLVSFLFGLLLRRAGELYFAIATLGFAEIGLLVCRKWESFGGIDGDRIGIPRPMIAGERLTSQFQLFWIVLAGLALVLLLGALVERSPLRRELIAARRSSEVAASLGARVLYLRVGIFVFGSMLGAFGGAIYAHWQGSASVDSFGLDLGIGLFMMVLLGGTRSMWGAVLGGAVYVILPERLRFLNEYREVLYGALLLIVMISFPQGLLGLVDQARASVRRRRDDAAPIAPTTDTGSIDDLAGGTDARS